MPLTEKGASILRNMTREYGEKRGKEVFYASRNAGKITGVDDVEEEMADDWNESDHPRAENGQFGQGGKPDTAEANVPMSGSRGKRLDQEITKNVKAQKSAERDKDKERNKEFRSDKEHAKALAGEWIPKIVAGSKGVNEKEATKFLDQMVKWEPAKFLKMVEKFSSKEEPAKDADLDDFWPDYERAGELWTLGAYKARLPELSTANVRELINSGAEDADWEESKHPRAENGQFGEGGGNASKNEIPRGGWTIRNKETGKSITETYDPKKISALNTSKYEAIPTRKHLEQYNRAVKKAGGVEPHAGWHRELINNGAQDSIAFDKASVRSVDENGHMRVERSPISRAVVSPYYGREIPEWQKLGLDPDKIYNLYRDAEELKKAAPTFAGKPILLQHKASMADNHPRDITIGSIGEPVEFDGDTLYAPLNIWDQEAIDAIEDGSLRDLSCGYLYDCDLASGTAPDGTHFDGRMVNVRANHLAQVEEGRVPGAYVADGIAEMQWALIEAALTSF